MLIYKEIPFQLKITAVLIPLFVLRTINAEIVFSLNDLLLFYGSAAIYQHANFLLCPSDVTENTRRLALMNRIRKY